MDWPPQCETIKERLETLYSLDALEPFLQLTRGQTLPNEFDGEIVIRERTSDDTVAGIWLEVSREEVTIHLLARYSKSHKGVVKDILYLIICKAIQLDLPITFIAVPSSKSVVPGMIKNAKPEKLHKYYTNIGFTQKETSSKKENRIITYHTSVNTLTEIIRRWQPAEGKGGRRKTRRTCNTRRKSTIER